MTEAKSPREIAETTPGEKILTGLREAIDGRVASVTIAGVEYTRLDMLAQALCEARAEIGRLQDVCGLHWRTIEDANRRAEQALSYAAERERLLAEADAAVSEAHEWLSQRGQIDVSPGSRWERILTRHQSRLSSRPATEGKGDD